MTVYDFAIDVGSSSSRFYENLANQAETEGVKKIFGRMAQDERRLVEKYEALKETETPVTASSSAKVSPADLPQSVFNVEDARRITSDLDAYSYVIDVESRLVSIYEEAANKESNEEARKVLLQMASDERRELESISAVYDFVNAPNEYLAWSEFSNLEEFHNFGRDEG